MVTFYIARSIDEKITKVGITQDLKLRLKNLKHTDKIEYILLYESHYIDRREGKRLEDLVYEEFKDYVIRGRERFSTHPILILQFVLSAVRKELKQEYEGIYTKYSYFKVSQSRAQGERLYHPDVITDENFVSYITMLIQGDLRTLAFGNVRDAINVANRCKYRLDSYKKIPSMLYGLEQEEYYKTLSEWKKGKTKIEDKVTIYLPFDYKPSN